MDVLSSLTSKPLTLTLTDDSSSLTSILISPPFQRRGRGGLSKRPKQAIFSPLLFQRRGRGGLSKRPKQAVFSLLLFQRRGRGGLSKRPKQAIFSPLLIQRRGRGGLSKRPKQAIFSPLLFQRRGRGGLSNNVLTSTHHVQTSNIPSPTPTIRKKGGQQPAAWLHRTERLWKIQRFRRPSTSAYTRHGILACLVHRGDTPCHTNGLLLLWYSLPTSRCSEG